MYKLALTLPASALLGLLLPAARPDEPLRLKPTNLAVNTRADEDNPHLASDGLTLYYASNAKGKYDLMVSTRSKLNQPWGKGKALEDWVQTEVDDRSVFVTPENLFPQYLYYATKKDKKNNNFDVFVAVKQFKGKAFSSPVGIDAVDTGQDEMHPRDFQRQVTQHETSHRSQKESGANQRAAVNPADQQSDERHANHCAQSARALRQTAVERRIAQQSLQKLR